MGNDCGREGTIGEDVLPDDCGVCVGFVEATGSVVLLCCLRISIGLGGEVAMKGIIIQK